LIVITLLLQDIIIITALCYKLLHLLNCSSIIQQKKRYLYLLNYYHGTRSAPLFVCSLFVRLTVPMRKPKLNFPQLLQHCHHSKQRQIKLKNLKQKNKNKRQEELS